MILRAAKRLPLPPGTFAVAAGVGVNGLAMYGFFVLAAHALGPQRYAPVSTLWAVVVVTGPGFFLPLEQEVGRALSARRARHTGGRPVVILALLAGAMLSVILCGLALAVWPLVLSRLFDGDPLLLAALCLAMVGYAAEYLARGTLSGNGRFGAYSRVLAAEGLSRIALCALLVVIGSTVAGLYAIGIGVACGFAVAAGLLGQRGLLAQGPDAPRSELTASLGWLLAGSVLAQFLLNSPVLALKLIVGSGDQAVVSAFFTGLVMTRLPLFAFQAVQAALIPRLSALAVQQRWPDVRALVLRLCAAVLAIGVLFTAATLLVGPPAIRLLFPRGFDLGATDLAVLAAASGAYMLALALAQALIALHNQVRAAACWLLGVATFLVGTLLGSGTLARVEFSFLAACVVATTAMAAAVRPVLGNVAPDAGEPEDALRADPLPPLTS